MFWVILRLPRFDGHQDKGNIPEEVFDSKTKKIYQRIQAGSPAAHEGVMYHQ
jgi:hypothetical protein